MQVNWKSPENQSPILFAHKANWAGFKIIHRRIMPGEMPECTFGDHEVNVTLSGSIITEKQTVTGKRQVTCGAAGNICLTPAGQPIAASWGEEYEYLAIDLKPAFISQIALEANITPRFELLEIYKTEDPLIQHIGLALLAEANSEESAGRLYADSLAQTLVLHLIKNYSTAKYVQTNFNGGLSGYKLRRATEFINEHLEQDLSLAEIAEVADLSQFHFARAFRRTTGLTPQQYLMQRRVERAKQLLATGDLPLVEISMRSGFKNQSHFTTLFRKFTALTPKAWRELKHA
ncbi:MAG: AraC family transcriptional regulator [Pyrinomonadaceae bacterium]